MAKQPPTSGERERLLQALLEREGLHPEGTDSLQAAGLSEAPLSFPQQRLWYLAQLEPDSRAYHIPAAYLLTGPLDVEALRKSFAWIVNRHEVLRSTYHGGSRGEPLQRVRDADGFNLPLRDLSAVAQTDRDHRTAALVEAEGARPFDLSSHFPIRALLIRLDDDSHVLAMTLHHIASDGWSSGILARELSQSYEAFCGGSEPEAVPLPVQYSDYAVWQLQHWNSEALQSSLAALKECLQEAPALSTFPADHDRPAVSRHAGSHEAVAIAAPVVEELKGLARSERATLYMALLAGLKVLLFKYSGQDDLVIGSPTAGRTRTELEPLVGFFVNNLVLRTDLGGDPTFRELLGRVRHSCLTAYEHQDVPFERLVEELQPVRSLGYSPLFQVSFSFHNMPTTDLRLAGLKVKRYESTATFSKFDWALSLRDRDGSLAGAVEYDTELFAPSTVRSQLADLAAIFEAVVDAPDLRLSEMPEIRWTPPAIVEGRSAPAATAEPVSSVAERTAPAEDEARMLAIWREVLGKAEIGPNDNYFEAGGTSMQSLRLIARVAEEFGTRLPASTVFTAGTPAGFLERLSLPDASEEEPLLAARKEGTRPPLFLAPGHDGDQFTLGTLLRYLDPQQPLYGLEPMGVDDGSPLDLVELAGRYARAILGVQPSGPYLLAGYCSGATVAWEIARQLEAAGGQVGLVALVDSGGPVRGRAPGRITRWLRSLQRVAGEFRALVEVPRGRRLEHARTRLARARRRLTFMALAASGRELDQLPARFRPMFEEMERIDRIIELHRQAHAGYEPPPFDGRTVLLQPTRRLIGANGVNGWTALAGEGLRVRSVIGYNNKLLSEPYVRYTAGELDSAISQALEE